MSNNPVIFPARKVPPVREPRPFSPVITGTVEDPPNTNVAGSLLRLRFPRPVMGTAQQLLGYDFKLGNTGFSALGTPYTVQLVLLRNEELIAIIASLLFDGVSSPVPPPSAGSQLQQPITVYDTDNVEVAITNSNPNPGGSNYWTITRGTLQVAYL